MQVCVHRHHLPSEPAVGKRVFAVVHIALFLVTAGLIDTEREFTLVRIHIPHLAVGQCISGLEVSPQRLVSPIEVTTLLTAVDDATQCSLQRCTLLPVSTLIIGIRLIGMLCPCCGTHHKTEHRHQYRFPFHISHIFLVSLQRYEKIKN